MPLYRESKDCRVSSAGIRVGRGRRWQAREAVARAEARLRHSGLVDTVAVGRAGLGSHTRPRFDRAQGREGRQLMQEGIRAEVEEKRHNREMLRPVRSLTPELWKSEPARLRFLIQAVYDVLPCQSNLHYWGLAETPACPLCQAVGTLGHILSCCPKALGDGRYTWRIDQVLRAVADHHLLRYPAEQAPALCEAQHPLHQGRRLGC